MPNVGWILGFPWSVFTICCFLFKVIVLFIVVKANQLLQHWGSYFSFGNKTYVVMLIFFSRVFDYHLISFTFDVVKSMIILMTSYIWNVLLLPFLPCIFLCLVRSHINIAITRAVTCIVCLCCHNFVQYFQLYNMQLPHIGHHTYIFSCRRKDTEPTSDSCLCSYHFTPGESVPTPLEYNGHRGVLSWHVHFLLRRLEQIPCVSFSCIYNTFMLSLH